MTSKTLADLQSQLQIDKMVLDDEVIRQPMLFFEVSDQLTEAMAERDAAKEELAAVDAELDQKLRKKLAVGQTRVTEGLITSHVLVSPEHEKAFSAYLEAKKRSDKLEALKDAFKQRSFMLRDLVALHAANYYESTSMKPTQAQDVSHYQSNRQRINNARVARSK